MEAVILIGIQATGKSTFYYHRFFLSHLRINLDMLKTRQREKKLIETCLEIGQAFVVDNTNPTIQDREKYIKMAKANGFTVVGYYFESKITDAIHRNLERNPEQTIPEIGIRGTHSRLEIPNYSEGFDKLHFVKILPDGTFAIEDWHNEI